MGTPDRSTLLSLAPELLLMIIDCLEKLKDKQSLVRTCKAAQRLTEPHLYWKIYTKIGTQNDTAWLLRFLDRRPDVVPMIHYLVLDEWDPRSFQQLLAREFPNLESIIAQHEGPVTDERTATERRALCRAVRPQLRMTNLTLSVQLSLDTATRATTYYKLEREDRSIFRHPSLTRIRLSYLDFSCLADTRPDYLIHENLKELHIETSMYTEQALTRLISPSKKLWRFRLHHDRELPFPASLYPRILSSARESLGMVFILLRYMHPTDDVRMDFGSFPALNSLTVHPRYILGNDYGPSQASQAIIRQRLNTHLPPNLQVFGLEGLVPMWPCPPPGMKVVLADRDWCLVHMLLAERELVPKLVLLGIYYLERLTYPVYLHGLARERGIKFTGLYSSDELGVVGTNLTKMEVFTDSQAVLIEEDDRSGRGNRSREGGG
ncbi:uncharacterized protein BCR38DRAFT_443507 [Pseudomassariella vexata]|uniref:F-box domain-containing protein n=1 Tax=Pseudomassariella vexata TaxID=1141098 RepID=A0A1Y2DMV7_9PEZI|nr:uncharacterized protein BCR38DRAFT_443507 [Pseudomassariella vexata]ORY59975.1 hypothetical protein BCR38DRAFT_443507 [Pseudomassariella vexata]